MAATVAFESATDEKELRPTARAASPTEHLWRCRNRPSLQRRSFGRIDSSDTACIWCQDRSGRPNHAQTKPVKVPPHRAPAPSLHVGHQNTPPRLSARRRSLLAAAAAAAASGGVCKDQLAERKVRHEQLRRQRSAGQRRRVVRSKPPLDLGPLVHLRPPEPPIPPPPIRPAPAYSEVISMMLARCCSGSAWALAPRRRVRQAKGAKEQQGVGAERRKTSVEGEHALAAAGARACERSKACGGRGAQPGRRQWRPDPASHPLKSGTQTAQARPASAQAKANPGTALSAARGPPPPSAAGSAAPGCPPPAAPVAATSVPASCKRQWVVSTCPMVALVEVGREG